MSDVSDAGLKNIDAYLTAKKRPTLSSKLKRMPVSSFKDLAVKGNDVMRLGLRGKKVGEALWYALEVAVRDGKNNKAELLDDIKRQYRIEK